MNTKTLRSAVVRIAAVAVVACGSVGITAGTVSAEEADKKPDVQAKTMDIELTPKQAHELRHQWMTDRDLSPQQALDVVGITRAALVPARVHDAASAADDGEAESTLDCSTMYLWGDSDGNWVWSNRFLPRSAGPALFGRGSVTTNAIAASYDTFNIGGLRQIAGDWHFCLGQLSAWYD